MMAATVRPAGDGLILYVVTVLMMVFGWTAVVARFIVRRMIKQIGLDDILMFVGLVLLTVTSGFVIAFIYYGGGYLSAELTPETIARGTKYYFVAQVFYCAATIPIKCSIAVALMRITAANPVYRYILYGIIGLSITSGLATAIGIMNVCRPIPALWGEVDGDCDATINTKVAYFYSAMCIITDWTLAILPTRILWNIQIKRRIRISVAILLALGAFASCATIVRLRFLLYYNDPNEFLYGSAKIAIWSMLELGIGVWAGSMAHLRPLLRFIPCLSKLSYAESSNEQQEELPQTWRDAFKMETLRTAGGGRVMGKRDKEIYRDLKGSDDGESQNRILSEGTKGKPDSSSQGVTKVTQSTLSGEERDADGAAGDSASSLPLQVPEPARNKGW